jgi:hypothetical protein
MSTPDPWAEPDGSDPDAPSLNEDPGVADVRAEGRHLIVNLNDGTAVMLHNSLAAEPEQEAEPG